MSTSSIPAAELITEAHEIAISTPLESLSFEKVIELESKEIFEYNKNLCHRARVSFKIYGDHFMEQTCEKYGIVCIDGVYVRNQLLQPYLVYLAEQKPKEVSFKKAPKKGSVVEIHTSYDNKQQSTEIVA